MKQTLAQFYESLDHLYETGEERAVETFLINAQKQTDFEILVAVYNELGAFYRSRSMFDKALSAFQEAEGLLCLHFEDQPMSHAVVLNNLAGVYRMARNAAAAIADYHRALAIYDASKEVDTARYAALLNNLALAYWEADDRRRAQTFAERARDCARTLSDKSLYATSLVNLAAIYDRNGAQTRAVESLKMADDIFILQAYQRNPHRLAAKNMRANILWKTGLQDEAIAIWREALLRNEALFGCNVDCARICGNLARALWASGNKEKSRDYLSQATAIYQRCQVSLPADVTALRIEMEMP